MPRLALGFALLCVSSGVAAAQSAGNMQLDAYQPAMDARGYLSVNGTSVLGSGELSFGLGSIDWGHRMLDFQAGSASYSVDDMVTSTLVGALGLRVAGVPFELGMSLPLTIMNGTDGRVNAQGVGDLGMHLKARLLHLGPLGIGALASVYLPTASKSDGFLGEPGVSSQFEGLADVSLGRLRLGVNAGVRLQPTQTFTDTMMGTMGTITTSTLLPVGAAAAVALVPEKVELIGEIFGALPAGATKNYESLEALGGVKVYLARNSYMTLGAGRGIVAENGSPDFRAVGGIVFEPKPAARRVAIVPDDNMATPPAKAEPDPDADRDGDGVPDKDDKCPDVPGELWNQGCPDTTTVVVGDSELVVLKSIDFEYDSAKLKTTAFPVLDAVVKALQDNPDIELVEIGGHTDERGSDAYNLDLSDRRAASVMAYLVEHGIASHRLASRGYGKRKPLDSRHSEAAWAKNRRVEFVIEKRDGQACDTAGACGAPSR
jgi:outer membrane protein OmpA-like peptidoglycan-associated protein